MGKVRSLSKGQMLFMAGDAIDAVYFILSGRVQEYYSSSAGDVSLRQISNPGSYLSLHLVVHPEAHVYTYTSEAVGDTRCFVWKPRDFLNVLNREPALAFQVARVLSCCFENSCRLNCLCQKTHAAARVAGYLLRQCRPLQAYPGDDAVPNRVVLQTHIRPLGLHANAICLARETFSRVLSSLQGKKIIHVERGVVEIQDLEALKKISGIEQE